MSDLTTQHNQNRQPTHSTQPFGIEPLPHPRTHEVAAWAARGLAPLAIKHAMGNVLLYKEVRFILASRACRDEVAQIGRAVADATIGHAIATRAIRVAYTSERHRSLQQIVEERAAAANPRLASPNEEFVVWCAEQRGEPVEVMLARFPEWGFEYDVDDPLCGLTDPFALGVPGAETGLLTCNIKSIGRGEDTRIVREWSADTSLAAALRQEEEAAARHLGEWAPSKITTIIPMKAYFGFDPEDL